MNLLRPFTGTGAVFFPFGIPPDGTCEFATDECIKHCYQLNPKNPDFDEEILIPNEEKKKIYNSFMSMDIEDLYSKIHHELAGLQTPILHWFGSGDCISGDVDRISEIIDRVRHSDFVVQMGFTRNIILWKRHKDIFSLTIDHPENAQGGGMYSIPNYESEVSVMYSPFYQVKGGLCGPTTCDDILDAKLSHYINCRTCRRMKTGCFDRR